MTKKMTYGVLFLITLLLCSCSGKNEKTNLSSSTTIKVGVFQGHGGAATCIREAYAACMIDPEMEVRYITSGDMARGELQGLDALIIPGGGGSNQYLDMGETNRAAIKDWVEQGGTVMGICAGAYLLSNTPGYASMGMIGAKAIDIEHDNRGHGVCKVTLNDNAKKIFPEVADRDTLYIVYYEGPVFVPADSAATPEYETLAMMMSDVHVEGNAPSNMTNNKPFYTHTVYGKGHVLSSVGHPEGTPGMQWMVPRLIRWAMGKELIEYKGVVHPDNYNAEILCTPEVAKREGEIYEELLYAGSEEKIAAIHYLDSVCSWSGKSWVRGLLYEKNTEVQMAAVHYMLKAGYTAFLDDVKEAVRMQKDPTVLQKMQIQCDSLQLYFNGTAL